MTRSRSTTTPPDPHTETTQRCGTPGDDGRRRKPSLLKCSVINMLHVDVHYDAAEDGDDNDDNEDDDCYFIIT